MAYLSVKDHKSETLMYISQRVCVNEILIVFATQFDFHGRCNIKACQFFFIVNVNAHIYVFIPLKTGTLSW